MIASSLSYEHVHENKSIIKLDSVSNGIYFIFKGSVTVYYTEPNQHGLVMFEEGSYFGDISYIF
jgi:CRP-like cAMP-binding protein